MTSPSELDIEVTFEEDTDRASRVCDAVKRIVEMLQEDNGACDIVSVAANLLGYSMLTLCLDPEEVMEFVGETLSAYENDPNGDVACLIDVHYAASAECN